MNYEQRTMNCFDCIVIGAGHAGVEAAHAAAKIGCRTLLLTMSRSTVAAMSCNPAIGGLAKGQIAREVDALGGLMGLATDAAGIQFRILNRSKGPAVQSPRAQTDKYRYAAFILHALEQTDNLTIVENTASEIEVKDGKVAAVICKDGTRYETRTVIVTAGTFLRGLMHIGTEQFSGGRRDEPASEELSASLEKIGLKLGRLKTGTPPRLDAKTIDFDKLEIQYGDETITPFSFMTARIDRPQMPCWVTYTNDAIHTLLRDNLSRAPLYTGQITSTGPRYCPSIESKIVRFADKKRHQVFLEPEDEPVTTIYCNGISTSVPRDVQEQMIRLLPGTENARIVHYAYAIEYDYCPPVQLKNNLETKRIEGLFLAGQINGTSGYEEAAGQGIIAGVNAARKIQGREPLVLGRQQAYIGVLIDDLLTKAIDEPYRMFTSRAEFRLSLRSDNADRRLTHIGKEAGLVDEKRWSIYQDKLERIAKLEDHLRSSRSKGLRLWQLLQQPGNTVADTLDNDPAVLKMQAGRDVIETVTTDAKYQGYLAKQERLVGHLAALESKKIPDGLDYNGVAHLRAEAKEKLSAHRPATLAQAGRIGGITPADIVVIQIHMRKTCR